MRKRRLQKSFAIVAAASVIVAACGGDDDDDSGSSDPAETEQTGDGDAGDDGGDTSADEAADDAGDDGGDADDGVASAGDEATGDVDTEVEKATDVATQGGELIIGLEAEIPGMRPTEDTCASSCYNVLNTIYDKLMETTADGGLEGWLLESITPNDDFTVWTGTLREGVEFHDGTPLTANTIAEMFPIQQAGAQSAAQISASGLENVEATDELEVTYTLARTNSAFPAYLERAQIGLVFDPAQAADLDAWNAAPNGTGPFAFVSRDIDNETIVERNPDYWGTDSNGVQLPYLDKISFRPIPDEGTRLDATLSGTTDVAHTLRQGTIRDARAARDGGEDIILYEFQGSNVGGGIFNVLSPPLDDVRVRRGLVRLISQEQAIEALGGTGISLPGTQWFSPDSPWYSEAVATSWNELNGFDFEAGVASITEYVNDPERSDGKAVGEPVDIELSCPPDPTLTAAMQTIENVWTQSEVINVNQTSFDQQTHIGYALGSDNGFVGQHSAHCWRVASDQDPSTVLNPAFAPPTVEIAVANELDPETTVSPLNWTNYFDLQLFGTLIEALSTDDFDTRAGLYESVMMKLTEDVPGWYSGHTATAFITDPSVVGINNWTTPGGTLGSGLRDAEGRWHSAWISN